MAPLYTNDDVRAAVAESRSYAEALRRLGLRAAGGNFQTLKKRIRELSLSIDHFDPHGGDRRYRSDAKPLDQVLVKNSSYKRSKLKQRLYDAGLKPRACEVCGQGEEWNGRSMPLILDHVNGVWNDNRIENLRIVCPNCNATLDTHCGRQNRILREVRACLHCGGTFQARYEQHWYCSRACGTRHPRTPGARPETRKVERPPYEQLKAELAASNFSAVGRRYGVSDNAVRKWVRFYEREERRMQGRGGG